MYVFFGKNGFILDSIICWDFEKKEWQQINTEGTKMEKRVGSTVHFVDSKNSFFIFGGLDGDGFSSNQIFSLSLDSFTCQLLSKAIIDGQDYGVHFHAMAFDKKDNFYFFGGKSEKGILFLLILLYYLFYCFILYLFYFLFFIIIFFYFLFYFIFNFCFIINFFFIFYNLFCFIFYFMKLN